MQIINTDRPHDPGEAFFGFDELFFSRTDEAGIIRFGNSVFQRVSVYSWEELLNKPHKIVRHPDTPRAVFRLLWSTIKSGKPIGAYVKNRAKDGRHYWVFAIVTPVQGGFLSVRLRPSSEIFRTVQEVYPALAAQEREEKLEPDVSLDRLVQTIGGLGYDSYADFSAAALSKELAARDRELGRPEDGALAMFTRLLARADGSLEHAARIQEAYTLNEIVPTNFRILASQLGQDGAAIGVISNSYAVLSDDMRNILDQFVRGAAEVRRAMNDGLFLVGTARVQREMVEVFASNFNGAENASEVDLLNQQGAAYYALAKEGLQDISVKVAGFRQSCLEMNRIATGLEVMRVIGKVECSRHVSVKERVDKLLSDLKMFQVTMSDALREINQINVAIEEETGVLLQQTARAA